MKISTDPGVWLAAILTVGIFSFLYKDNLYFKLVESVFIGFGAAHALVLGYYNVVDLGIRPLFARGDLMPVVPLVLGIALYSRFIKGYG
jgi:hypothetical protein